MDSIIIDLDTPFTALSLILQELTATLLPT